MTAAGSLQPVRLRCEHLSDPLAIDERRPHLSWALSGNGRDRRQVAWRVVASCNADKVAALAGDLWDSGVVEGRETLGIAYGGEPLASLQRVFWRAASIDAEGRTGWSEPASFGMGLLAREEWTADWIGLPVVPAGGIASAADGARDSWAQHLLARQMRRVCHLRRSFRIDRPVARATLFATARGLYRLLLDGEAVDDRVFAPGWTDYRRRIEVQAVDLTSRLTVGEHALACLLGEGWYAGYVGFRPKQRGAHYGVLPWFRAQLHILHADGSEQLLTSDGTWRSSNGGIIASDLLLGEIFDAREEQAGWMLPGFDDAHWARAAIGPPTNAELVAERGPPVRVVESLSPVSVRRIAAAGGGFRTLVDFGQNLAGRVRLDLATTGHGARVMLRHAEVLEADGELHTDNLRTARAEDLIVTDGAPLRHAPSFTMHGFRHVEISGLAEPPAAGAIKAEAIMSDTRQTGQFRCSHPMVNQLWQNILWSQRSNFLSVPTDCPQRDERLGWTGDAQIFVQTAAFNMDVAGFFSKWMIDVVDAQWHDGLFTDVAPLINFENGGAPGWGDGGIVIPWTMWRMTGDIGFIDRFWSPMGRHIARVEADNPDHVRRRGCNFNFGDWLSVDEETPRDLVATAWFARIADLMARMADASGRKADAERYRALFARVRAAFAASFIDGDNRLSGDTQTAALMALGFGLLDCKAADVVAARLVAKISARGYRLTSGFLGLGFLMPVLCRIGHPDVAMKLLLQEDFPSWGCTIRHGATTIWEHWDSWSPDGGIRSGMNSFNHYAFGSVGAWLYTGLGGLDFDEQAAPLARAVIAPEVLAAASHGINWCETRFDSPVGMIAVAWRVAGQLLSCDVSIPANMQATIRLPGTLDGIAQGDGAAWTPAGDERVEARIGSGEWTFRMEWAGR